jgi:hypothetical protein
MAQPEIPQFSVHLGGGLYMDSNGVLSHGPEPGKPVYPAPGGFPVNPDAFATAFQGMAKALPDKDDPKSRVKFDKILDGIGMALEDKENLIAVLQGVGKVASFIGTVVPVVGAVLAVLTALLGLFKGPTALELLIIRRFDELETKVDALETQISQRDLRNQRSIISAALAALANFVRELENSPPDEAQLLLRRQEVRDKVSETGIVVRNLLHTSTWLASFDRREYEMVWPWIQHRLFTFPSSGAPQRALLPEQNTNVFDHRLMVPLVIFGVTGFLSVLRASAPEFRSTGENRDDLWDFAPQLEGLEGLVQNMRREGLARTVYTADDFQRGLGFGLPPDEVIDLEIPGVSAVLAPGNTRWAVGALDLRSHDDAYFTPGFTASTIQHPGPEFAKQGLLNVRWIPPAKLESYEETITNLGWEPANQPPRKQRRYRITNPEECASAANFQAQQDYADLLYSSGYLNLVHLLATVRNEATDPDRSQTVRSWAWLRGKPGASVAVQVESEPILFTGAIMSPAERRQQQYKATTFFTTQPLFRDRQLKYRVYLRTLKPSPSSTRSPDDYRKYYQVGYTDDPEHPGFKKLFTRTDIGQALDSFLIPVQGTTSIPQTREVNGTAKFEASTFDWWIPVKPPSVKPLGGVEIRSASTTSKASLRAAGWEEAALNVVSPPVLPTREGGVSAPDIPSAAVDRDAIRDQVRFMDLVGWEEGTEPAEGQARLVEQKEVHLDYALHWKADRLAISLKNNRPVDDRNYIVYVVVEETLSSGAVLHTVERVPITGQLTFVPQSFFDEETAAKEKVTRIFHDFETHYAKSLPPAPRHKAHELGLRGYDRETIAANPVLRQFELSNFSDHNDFRTLSAVVAQHPPAATILGQILTEVAIPVGDWPDMLRPSG